MTTKREFLEALNARLATLPEAERARLTDYFTELIDDRLELGMDESAAVSALGDIDALLRDAAPQASLPAVSSGASDYREAIGEVRVHLRNADGVITAASLPEGMSAQISASESNRFTWALEGGVLTVREVEAVRRSLFMRGAELTVALSGCAPEKVIVDSYGGDISLKGLDIGNMLVASSSSGDIEVKRTTVGGRTEVTLRSGDLDLSEVTVNGDCKVETTSGDVTVRRGRFAALRLRTASGDVDGERVEADTAAIGTTSGDVDLNGFAARALQCETSSGDIEMRRVDVGGASLSTASGDITLRLNPRPEGYRIQAQSRTGEVAVRQPAPAGEGAAAVHAVSQNGDISIGVQE